MDNIRDSPSNRRSISPVRMGARAVLLLICFIIFATTAAVYLTFPILSRPGNSLSSSARNDYKDALQVCTSDTIKTLQLSSPDFRSYQEIWVLCGNEIYDLDFLEDFDIRREKLLRQELDERVILWMVVGITISGVILAGLQLLASYRLAATNHGSLPEAGRLSIESGKLSIKSSVTGLLILALSLAFFVVYVKWVYAIQELNMEKPTNLTNSTPSCKISGYGSLGAPPSSPRTPDSSLRPEALPPASFETSRTQVPKQQKVVKFSGGVSDTERAHRNCR